MPNNFRLTGDYYVSKAGSDSNDGLTPNTPKLTVQAALNLATTGAKTVVIGAGVYNESITKTAINFSTISILGDGEVYINNTSFNTFNLNCNGVSGTHFFVINNIKFYNQTITLTSNGSASNSGSLSTSFNNCLFVNTIISASTPAGSSYAGSSLLSFTKCSLVTCQIPSTSVVFGTYSLFFNLCNVIGVAFFSATFQVTLFQNSVSDINTTLVIKNTATSSSIINNNIQGKIVMNTNGAVSGSAVNGVALSFAAHRSEYPTFNVNSISADPKFNNADLLDFTLQSSSPNIRAASDFISNIGGTEYAVDVIASDSPLSGATLSNITLAGGVFTITSPATSGTITTLPIAVQSFPATKPMTKINFLGGLEFNKSITAGTSGNQNVPDYDTYTGSAQGANPDRLTIRMRYSTQSAQPATSGEWDNGGYWTAGNYETFEINSKPKVDSNGKGNGDPAYLEFSGVGDLVPTWVQFIITLRNNYTT